MARISVSNVLFSQINRAGVQHPWRLACSLISRNGIQRGIAMSVLAACAMVAGNLLWACPFCLSPPMTLAEQISKTEIVVIVELLRFDIVNSGSREYPRSTVRIREYLQGTELVGKCDRLQPGQAIVVGQEIAGSPGDLFLLFGSLRAESSLTETTFASESDNLEYANNSSGKFVTAELQVTNVSSSRIQRTSFVIPEFISWNDTNPVSLEAIRYIKNAPPRSLPATERLLYFTEFLEHPDPLLSIDSWSEFANSTYDDVKAVRHVMPREKLRKWIADPNMFPERLGLYGMMLGLCGDTSDAEFLKNQIGTLAPNSKDSPSNFRYGTDGLMGGYLLLTGEEGITFLEQTRLNENSPVDSASAVMQAIEFIWTYESELMPKSRLKSAMRRTLTSDALRTITIAYLARWKDWECWPQLAQLFPTADHSTKKAIVLFAEECQKATNEDGALPGEAIAAANFLTEAQETSPELFRSTYKSDFNSAN